MSHLGRVDTKRLQDASLINHLWLRSRDGVRYDLKSASFGAGKATLGDALAWTWICHGKMRFTPKPAYARMVHNANTRIFAGFCHALIYNFSELLVLPPPTGTFMTYIERPPQHIRWVPDESGR